MAVQKLLKYDSDTLDVIAVGAHPDDVEIAIGGTLAALVQLGYRVGIVDLTDGEPTPLSPGPEVRLEEARQAAEILGIQQRIILDLPNRKLFDCFESRVALAKVFREYRPKLVMGIADKTPMASPDHWQATQITDAAVFYSRLTKWDPHFDHLPVHTISAQIWYPLGLKSTTPLPATNQIVMDIGHTLKQKIAAVKCYETQFPSTKSVVFDLVESHNRITGYAAGFQAGEVFYPTTPLGTKDLMKAILPGL